MSYNSDLTWPDGGSSASAAALLRDNGAVVLNDVLTAAGHQAFLREIAEYFSDEAIARRLTASGETAEKIREVLHFVKTNRVTNNVITLESTYRFVAADPTKAWYTYRFTDLVVKSAAFDILVSYLGTTELLCLLPASMMTSVPPIRSEANWIQDRGGLPPDVPIVTCSMQAYPRVSGDESPRLEFQLNPARRRGQEAVRPADPQIWRPEASSTDMTLYQGDTSYRTVVPDGAAAARITLDVRFLPSTPTSRVFVRTQNMPVLRLSRSAVYGPRRIWDQYRQSSEPELISGRPESALRRWAAAVIGR
jgi:hypothetical protein